MQSRAWIKLFQRIPPESHEILALLTSSGTEISIQTVLRLEEDFVLIKGRLSGTTDGGRVFFIPYDQIDYLGVTKEMRESEIGALLGEAPSLAPSAQRILDTPSPLRRDTETTPVAASALRLMPVAAADAESPLPEKPGERLAIPRRSGLIARLRARTTLSEVPEPKART